MYCEHYKCEISETGCHERQTGPAYRNLSEGRPGKRFVNDYCVSGKCAQGQAVIEKIRRNAGEKSEKEGRSMEKPALLFCKECGEAKPPERFQKSAASSTGRMHTCYDCINKKRAKKKKTDTIPKAVLEKPTTIVLDFSDYQELLAAVTKKSLDEMRPVPLQIMMMCKEATRK